MYFRVFVRIRGIKRTDDKILLLEGFLLQREIPIAADMGLKYYIWARICGLQTRIIEKSSVVVERLYATLYV